MPTIPSAASSKYVVHMDHMALDLPPETLCRYLNNRQLEINMMREFSFNQSHEFYELAKRIGHQVKGNAATFHFPELAKIAIQLEEAGLHRDREKVLLHLSAIEEYLNQQKAILHDLNKKTGS